MRSVSPLNPAQAGAVEGGFLSLGFPAVLQMPTGSGKTWLSEGAMRDVLAAGRRAIYLAPLRALANELATRWRDTLAPHSVGVFTGETAREGGSFPMPFADARLLVMTPERLDACTRAWRAHWSWLPDVDLVVADELHTLGDRRRGPRLEASICRLRRLNPFCRTLGLSATLGNPDELAAWLDGVAYRSDWRPIPLQWKTVRFRKATDKPSLLRTELARCARSGGKSLVFVQSRRRADSLAADLESHGLRTTSHHAGLNTKARADRENAFRTGDIDTIVCTPTLEMGVNLPVRLVALYDAQLWDGSGYVPLPVTSAWQRAGRAGRPGLDTSGEAMVFLPSWDRDAPDYARGHFEPVVSHLGAPAALAECIVAEVASGLSRDAGQLERAMAETLAYRQQRLPPVNRAVVEMVQAGMLLESRDPDSGLHTLRATRLGRIASRQMLTPETVLRLSRMLTAEGAADLTFFDILVACSATPDVEAPPVDFEDLAELAEALSRERSSLLSNGLRRSGETTGLRGRALLAAIRAAVATRRWTRLGDAAEAGEDVGLAASELTRVVEAVGRVLTAACAIVAPASSQSSEPVAPTHPSDEPSLPERLAALRAMVIHGIDETSVSLTMLAGVGGTLARRLAAEGIEDIEDLAFAEAEEVAAIRGISATKADAWIAEAGLLAKTRSAFAFRDSGPRLTPAPTGWPDEIDPYRLRRALDLTTRQLDAETWEIRGGSEPRVVRRGQNSLSCDCPDHARHSGDCKHILAVRLDAGEDLPTRAAERLQRPESTDDTLDLASLWHDEGTTAPKRSRR